MIEMFKIPFMQEALIAGVMIGALCAFLAVFVLLKRIVFVGMALTQISSLGAALGLLVGLSPLLLSLVFVVLGVIALSVCLRGERIPREAIIGAAYATATAAGVVLMAKSPEGESHMLDLLFGNILAVTSTDVLLMAGIFVGVALIQCLFYKEFLISSFDSETAIALGVRAHVWNLLFYLSLGIAIAGAIRVVGVLLVFGMLVIPGLVGLLLCKRLPSVFGVPVAAGVMPVVIGLYISYVMDLPAAPAIVLVSVLVLCAAMPVALVRK